MKTSKSAFVVEQDGKYLDEKEAFGPLHKAFCYSSKTEQELLEGETWKEVLITIEVLEKE